MVRRPTPTAERAGTLPSCNGSAIPGKDSGKLSRRRGRSQPMPLSDHSPGPSGPLAATFDDEPGRPARPGMREVARRAGVAMSSVSRVLSGHPDVSPAMRRTVMAAVEDLGYRPD